MRQHSGSLTIGARAKTLGVSFVVLATIAFPAFISHAAIGAPVITSPGENTLQAGASYVRVSGTAPVKSQVAVKEGVTTIASHKDTDVVPAGGTWSFNIPLSDGTHTLTAIATKDGETSLPSSPVTFENDARAPRVTIDTPKTNDYTFTPTEPTTFSGTASDERTMFAVRLRYYLLDRLALEELAECQGCRESSTVTWTHNPTLSPGYYKMTATAIDSSGNQTVATRTFTTGPKAAGPTLPETPGDLEIEDLEIPIPESPLPGDTVPGAEKPIVIRGDAEGSAEVEAYETKAGLGSLGYVDSDNKGKWRFRLVLPSGSYSVAFRAIDENGQVSPWSSVLPFDVDATRPALEILTGDNTVFLPLQPVILQGQTSDNRGVQRILVEYWLGDTMVARDLAGCSGCPGKQIGWSDQPKLSQAGYYYAIVRAIDIAGNSSFVDSIHFVKVV